MRDLISTAITASPWVAILTAVWLVPDWVMKWIEVRNRWRGDR